MIFGRILLHRGPRLRPEQTTVLEQLGQGRHVFVSLPTGYAGYWKSECLTVFPKLMDLLRPYESNSSITWSNLWGGLVRGKKIISLITPSYPKDDAHFVRLVWSFCYIYIDKNVFKTTRSFCYQWFRVSTLQANATKHGKINFKPMNRS